jgi:23S rRNA pseudouridine1911/1915/1917 synthase
MRGSLSVLFEDEHCLGIVKAAGQFVQGTWAPPGEQTLEQEVRAYLDPADPASAYVGIVHRLDRPVSGVLLWAKTAKAARRLSAQFERRQVVKEYWAIAEEREQAAPFPPGRQGAGTADAFAQHRWTDWLTHPGVPGVARSVEPGTTGARMAVTRFRLERPAGLRPGLVWVRLWPETGRTHQLRVQAAVRGWPILGDSTYGAAQPFAPGIALHARALRLRHPILGTPLELEAPLPHEWNEFGPLG